jgi:hypothetical protein
VLPRRIRADARYAEKLLQFRQIQLCRLIHTPSIVEESRSTLRVLD